MADVIETDYTTDPPTVTERKFTKEEKAQRKADEESYKKMKADELKAKQDRLDAIEHAKSLGFTDVMIKQMFPGLGDPNE